MPKNSLEKLNRVYLSFKSPSMKYSNIMVILICLILTITLNVHNSIATLMKNSLFEVNSLAIRLINKPFEITQRAKIFVDEQIYQKKIKILEEQNQALQNLIMMLEAENKEVKYLKELLNYSVSSNHQIVATRILKSSLNLSSQDFLIPIGRSMNISLDAYVVDSLGLIGKIIEVGEHSAKVRMINSINSKTPVVFSQSREKAILIGNSTLSNKLHIIYCSNIDSVIDGELAVTSGNGNIYPYGIVIGKVIKKDTEIYIETLFDVDKLEFVKVYSK